MSRKPFILALLILAGGEARAAEFGFGFSGGVRALDLGLMLGDTSLAEARGAEATVDTYLTLGKSFPIGASLAVSRQSYDLSRARQFFDHLDVNEASAGLIFLPPGGKARPMARIAYTFFGTARAAQNGGVTAMVVSGTHVAVGAQVELGKGSLLGFGLDFGQTKATSAHTVFGGKSFRMKSTAAFVGGEVAI